jgi:hypothetical protein
MGYVVRPTPTGVSVDRLAATVPSAWRSDVARPEAGGGEGAYYCSTQMKRQEKVELGARQKRKEFAADPRG